MNKLSCFVATTLIGSSISFAHAEPKMSGTIYIMTEVEHNNKTGVTSTTISDKSSSLYLSDEVPLNNDLWLKWQLGSFIYFDSDRWAAGVLPTHTSRSTATKTSAPSKWATSVRP